MKIRKIGQSAAEPRTEEGSTTIPLQEVGKIPKYGAPKRGNSQGEDIVYSFVKTKVKRKIDYGSIMIRTTPQDLEALKSVLDKGGFEAPAIKMSVYKNRRGRYKDILLWCRADTATCRIEPLFATNYQYELVSITDLIITVQPNKENK